MRWLRQTTFQRCLSQPGATARGAPALTHGQCEAAEGRDFSSASHQRRSSPNIIMNCQLARARLRGGKGRLQRKGGNGNRRSPSPIATAAADHTAPSHPQIAQLSSHSRAPTAAVSDVSSSATWRRLNASSHHTTHHTRWRGYNRAIAAKAQRRATIHPVPPPSSPPPPTPPPMRPREALLRRRGQRPPSPPMTQLVCGSTPPTPLSS